MNLGPIDQNSLLYVVLNAWVPAVLTIVFGSFLASLVVPRLQRRSQRFQLRLEKRSQLCEQATQAFGRYVVSWRRLCKISEFERSKHWLSKDEKERKKGFVIERNARRDDLLDALRLCRLYCSAELVKEIDLFMAWDETQSVLTLDELAPIEEWRSWETKIVEMLKNEIS